MASAGPTRPYRFGPFELQRDERRLLRNGKAVPLRPLAFDILSAMVDRAGHLVTKDELLERVWRNVIVGENTLQAHVSALRKVLGAEAIATISGRGYRFTLEVTQDSATATRATTPKHNLPYPLTTFIGREKEIVQIKQFLASKRLLTLTGAGGCGKTRLALQVAADMLDAYPDGSWLVELAPLGDSTLIAQTVANVLAVKEQAGRELTETVAEWLGSRHLLLVLDNAEHLLGACAQLADLLLRRCAQLAILVTSRERLGIAGELTYRVPSLSVPEAQHDETSEEVLGCEAARLFIDRARLQRPDFRLTTKDTAALASICRRLGGIALAIELAAPRVRAMSLEELSGHLDDRFGVLTGGSRTALPRQRTLRSLIDWSYDLLEDSEKRMLRRCSVFAGGWTVEAAERVCGGENAEPSEALDLLTALTDKNLVVAETDGDVTRFGMLETVRHYAQDRLRESGEEASVRARHLAYFMQVADQLHNVPTDSDLQVKLNRLDREHDNLRAALAWCEAAVTRSASGLPLAGQLYWFWRTRGYFAEGRGWIARLLAVAPSDERRRDRARAISTAGVLAYLQDDYAAAEAHYRDALAIWRELGHRGGITAELGNLGNIALNRGDHSSARALYEQALAIARDGGDRRHILVLLQNLASITHELGDFAAAQTLLEECLPISREVGRWSASEVLGQLGQARHAQGDTEGARALLTEALEGQREFGNRQGIAKMLVWLGVVSQDVGDISTAKMQLREALAIQLAVGDKIYLAAALEAFAGLSLEFASPTDAARLWGRAQRLREEIGAPQGRVERKRYERQVAAARGALHDDAAFDLAWDEGRSLTLDEVVRYAMEA